MNNDIEKLKTSINFFNILYRSIDQEKNLIRKNLQDLFFNHQKNIAKYIEIHDKNEDYELETYLNFNEKSLSIQDIINKQYSNTIDIHFMWMPKTDEGLIKEINNNFPNEFSMKIKSFMMEETNIFAKTINLPIRIFYE